MLNFLNVNIQILYRFDMETFIARVGVLNRITIPKNIVEILKIKPGDRVRVQIEKYESK